ncbi:MAG: DUF4389 domain-containing protein [Acidimicrobiia bacterium]|nr:DUF4389 domain-containing protein [Acidimicrobiia bacterium]
MTVEDTSGSGAGYPARLEIDYPERSSRIKTLFGLILVIPIAAMSWILVGGLGALDISNETARSIVEAFGVSGGSLFLPPLLTLLFRRKYPRWWFDWNLELYRFTERVFAYLSLLRDEYPSTDEQQAVHLDLDYPDAVQDLNGWLPLVKWLLAIPHYIVLTILTVGEIVVVVIAWFAIVLTGRYPRWMFSYVVGVHRWTLRVQAYAWLLITDRYPPFRLSA